MKYNYWKDKRIVITGGAGFLGSHLIDELKKRGAKKFVIPRKEKHDLRKEEICLKVTKKAQIVFHLAGVVGGIGFNQANPATLFYDNIKMGINIIEACRLNLVGKLVIIGTICSYPKFTPVPFKEEDLWNGFPEETNAPYGVAKKALIMQAISFNKQYSQNILNLLPVNLYGPREHFESHRSHVIPALIKKFVDAKTQNKNEVVVWGTGMATREFIYVTDAARAISNAAEMLNSPEPINIGSGFEISIKDLAEKIKELIGFKGEIVWDITKPDGQPHRLLDTTKATQLFDFTAKTSFETGLKKTIEWYINHGSKDRQNP